MGDILIEEMEEEISNRIFFWLRKKAGLKLSEISFNELVDRKVGALTQPVLNISINEGSFQKVTLTTYKKILIVSLFIMAQELRGEKARRLLTYQLITQIAMFLLLEDLELPLQDKLRPVSFANVTDDKFKDAGYLIYQLNMTCSYNIYKQTEEDLGELESIMNYYYLQDPTDDGADDAQGLVELFGARGGNAFSIFRIPAIYGGRAGSDFDEELAVYGGKAGSTY